MTGKYHAISAGVLLLIVGLVYVLNRDGGGRRAAELSSDTTAASRPSSAAKQAQTEKRNALRKLLVCLPVPTRPATSQNRRVPRQSSPPRASGIGVNEKFADILANIEDETGRALEAQGRSDGFQPIGDLSLSKANSLSAPADWESKLVAIEQFPDDLASRYQCEQGWEWFDVESGRLMIRIQNSKPPYVVEDAELRFKASASASLKNVTQTQK